MLKLSSHIGLSTLLNFYQDIGIRNTMIIDEDLKEIGVTPIESLFANINLDKDGTGDKSTLARRHPNNLEFKDLNEKIDKCGIGEVKTLSRMNPLFCFSRILIMIIVL